MRPGTRGTAVHCAIACNVHSSGYSSSSTSLSEYISNVILHYMYMAARFDLVLLAVALACKLSQQIVTAPAFHTSVLHFIPYLGRATPTFQAYSIIVQSG